MTTTASLASWLANHVDAIAQDEAAGEIFSDVKRIVDDIERMVNRPIPPRYCGPCPTLTEDQVYCSVGLFAKRDAIEIVCWKCKMTHNVEKLIQHAMRNTEGLLYSAREVQMLMAEIGQSIPPRTWRYWRAQEKVIVRGWRGAEPMYWLSDVQELMAAKPQKSATGAAARQKCVVIGERMTH